MYVPASMASRGLLPDVCSRHGRPSTQRKRMVIESRSPGWTYVTILAGLLLFWILRALLRKAIVTPAWPFCDRCRRRRVVAIVIASAIVAAGVLTMVVPFFASGYTDAAVKTFAVGLVIAMLGYIGFHWATLASVARVRLTHDGQQVRVTRPSEAFAAQLQAHQPVPAFPTHT
jgi:hypothetical protein